ncbi:MAG: L-alanine exporter AlaE [Candidatus Woesearchaeota archaeon]
MSLDEVVEKERNSLIKKVKDFAIDTSANLLYWYPVLGANEKFVVGMSWKEMIQTRAGNLLFTVATSRLYTAAIDLSRKVFNPEYYAELKEDIEREKNWKTYLKDYVVDTSATIVYWNAVLAPWVKYVVGKDWKEVGSFVATSSVIYAVASRPFGIFLNKFRNLFDNKKK